MLEVRGRTWSTQAGASRRSFLKIGSLGLGGLTLPDLLAHRATQAADSNKRRDTAVILFWMAGGPSHHETFDPKSEATEIVRGPFGSIETKLPGLRISDQLPRLAQVADRFSIVRSLHHEHSVHDDASHWVQTGMPLLMARERGQQHPSQGSVVSHLRGPNTPGMPSYVCIPEAYQPRLGFYQNAAFLGPAHLPVNGGGDPSLGNYRLPEFVLPAGLTFDRIEHRRQLQNHLDQIARSVDQSESVAALDEARKKAYELIAGPKAREAFDLSREPAELRDRYGKHFWGQSALLARRLVEAGVTFVTINLYEKDVDWWDDHTTIEKNLRKRLPNFDQSLATLIEDLQQRGLAERVLVGAFGEFGRAPRVDAGAGRGHWPRAMSALLSGGGLRNGQIVGATTADGGEPSDRALRPADLLATMYHSLGIDHEQFIRDPQGRPIRVLEGGEPIRELVG
jgi:hypothetical protein